MGATQTFEIQKGNDITPVALGAWRNTKSYRGGNIALALRRPRNDQKAMGRNRRKLMLPKNTLRTRMTLARQSLNRPSNEDGDKKIVWRGLAPPRRCGNLDIQRKATAS